MLRQLEMGSSAKSVLLGPLLLMALAVLGCQPPAPAGNAAAPANAPPPPPGVPPPPPGVQSSPMGVEGSGTVADTPLDAAWRELIAVHEEQFNKLAGVHNEAEAEAAATAAVAYHKKRHAALTKIAQLGGSKPPNGAPAKLRQQYKEVEDKLFARDEVVSQMISPARREQLNQQLRQALESDPALAQDPFALSAETHTAGSGNIATVTLVNNKSLQGPAHQQMIARLQQLAGASKAEPLIEADGTYKVVFSPVADFASFIRGIDFGEVSNRSDAFRTFTLTIDPQRFQASSVPGGAGPFGTPSLDPRASGLPPGQGAASGRPPVNPFSGTSDQQKADFFARNGGVEKCVTLVLENAPRPGMPGSNELTATAKQIAGARSTFYLRTGGRQLLLLAPVEDIDALAAKIDFGTVTGQDASKRELYVTIPASPAASP